MGTMARTATLKPPAPRMARTAAHKENSHTAAYATWTHAPRSGAADRREMRAERNGEGSAGERGDH
jgi:hypothetical protein